MKKNLVILLSTLILSTTVLLADEFWEKKAFTEWTEKEAILIMQKSPWAHRLKFRLQSPITLGRDPENSDREDHLPDPDRARANPRVKELPGYSPYEQGAGAEEVFQRRYGSSEDLNHARVGAHGTSMGDRPRGGDSEGDTFLLPLIVPLVCSAHSARHQSLDGSST